MKQKWPERKDSLYSRCFHVVFTKGRESHKPGVPPVRIVQPTHGRDARATTVCEPDPRNPALLNTYSTGAGAGGDPLQAGSETGARGWRLRSKPGLPGVSFQTKNRVQPAHSPLT